MQLKELFDKHGSDKASKHRYHKVYEGVLSEIPVPVIWEIGVDAGASLAAWQEVLPGAVVVGVDLFKRHTMDEVRRNAPQASGWPGPLGCMLWPGKGSPWPTT